MLFKNILIAPTAFKGTLSPVTVAESIALGLKSSNNKNINIDLMPLADGGDGTIESVHFIKGGILHEVNTLNAVGKSIKSYWLELNKTAIIELASVCGIGMLHENEIDPMNTSTYGLGQIILDCLQKNKMEEIIIAVGGSASTDGGSGALEALGALFYDLNNQEFQVRGGESLLQISKIDLSSLKKNSKIKFRIASDINNPLAGLTGAAYVFAPQKGANEKQVEILDQSLLHYANILESVCNKSKRNESGSGAAGGTAFGLACALDADIISGYEWIANLFNLEEHITISDLVITGEGRLDKTSLEGKLVGKLAEKCKKYKKELWVITACVDQTIDYQLAGITKLICPSACKNYLLPEDITKNIEKEFKLSHNFHT
jgi:glycerate kinase